MIKPAPLRRGDTLAQVTGHLIGGIGAFSSACVDNTPWHQPLEVLRVQGNPETEIAARLGTSAHQVVEGRLSEAQVSFTLEVFESSQPGDPLTYLPKDSACHQTSVRGELRQWILNFAERHGIQGGLLHIQGTAKNIHTYGHTDPQSLTTQTKTFDHEPGRVAIEGWGNLSAIEGKGPFIHLHGTYATPTYRKGGHFIMDESTPFFVEKGTLLLYPVPKLIRAIQDEDFPTWKVAL